MNDVVAREAADLVAKGGRPKGSKNKITLLKFLVEETIRQDELPRMIQVCRDIVTDALNGDRDCRKLVWQALMSKAGVDQQETGGARPEIVIRTESPVEIHNHKVIEVPKEDTENVEH